MRSVTETTGRPLGQMLRVALLASCAGMASISLTAPAHAQDGADAADAEAIVITGSRIVRRDYNANSPIVTVDSTLFEQSSTAALETNLNKLPQFIPAQTPTLGEDIQPTATNTPGAATVSLRGIGANRNLVLVDGRRATPGNASGVVDISTIPAAAIERVEVISGGASATYGADAVAGVTNFILKKNFVGVEFDAQMGITERGDNREWQISGIMGTDFADGRGNISIAMSINDRGSSYQRDRKAYRKLWANKDIGGTQFFVDRPGIVFGFDNPITDTALQESMFPGMQLPGNPTVYTNRDGSAYVNGSWSRPTPTPDNPFATTYTPYFSGFNAPIDDFGYKLSNAGTLSQNNNDLYLILPMTRYNVFTRGTYEINDWISVFGQGLFSQVSTYTKNEPGPITGGWGVDIPWGDGAYIGSGNLNGAGNPSSVILNGMMYNGSPYVDTTPGNLRDNPTNPAFASYGSQFDCALSAVGGCTNTQMFQNVIPGDLQALLNARADPNAPVTITGLMKDPRETFTDVTTFNMIAGFEGKIPGTDWTWEIYGNHGQSETFARQTGIYSLSRLRTVMGAPNFGEGFSLTGNSEQGGFGASTGTCTTGLNIFGDQNYSEDCLEAVRADLKNRSKVQQTIWEANVQGTLLELPAGPLGAAVGVSHRSLKFEFINDTLTSQGRSFEDQALGIYPSEDTFGSYNVKEAYAEMLIPVIGDVPGIKKLSLEIGGRVSDYNTTGTSYTYKVLGDWEVTDWLRFRGGFNRAERSPNIAELYLASQQTFGVNTVGDPCSLQNPNAFSANAAANSNAANVRAVCEIMMNASGDPTTAQNFYTGNFAQDSGTFGFAWPTVVGNPNLSPETADTWTAGMVISSPFAAPALSRLRLTVDYFNIKVKDAIGVESIASKQQQCFDPMFNPAIATDPIAAAANANCLAIKRNTTVGTLGDVKTSYVNSGRFQIEGIDAQLDWAFDVGPGTLALNGLFNYMLHFKSAANPALPLVDYAGTFGTSDNGLNTGVYRWRLLASANYRVGPFGIGLQWQHLPAIEDGSEPLFPGGTATTGAPAYDVFALNGSFAINRDVNMRFGIENLFDKQPPLTNVNLANTNPAADGQLAGGSYNAQFYDTNGRRFYLGATMKF